MHTTRSGLAKIREATRKRAQNRPLKIGVLGSGANPWTVSHLILGEQAAEQFDLDFVLLMPAGEPVDKKVAPKAKRWKFTMTVARNNPRFVASRIEIDRDGPSYMVDTLSEIHRLFPGAEVYLIIGEDRAPTIKNWKDASKIIDMSTIICGPRYGCEAKVNADWLTSVLPAGARSGVVEIEYSATWIRKRIAAGKSVRYMVPDAELRDIKAVDAYAPAPNAKV
jgi:nicotinate-nucleotide adenylyltransferase